MMMMQTRNLGRLLLLRSLRLPRSLPSLLRHCSSSPPPLKASFKDDGDSFLLQCLRREFKAASDQEEQGEKANATNTFKPFELSDRAGRNEIVLRRHFIEGDGEEEVLVRCFLHIDMDEDNDDSGLQECLYMRMIIGKGEKQAPVEIVCCYDEAISKRIVIDHVFYNRQRKDFKNAYAGPYFEDLSPRLQKAFRKVVEARGITPKLARSVLEHLTHKYMREFSGWLVNVESFIQRRDANPVISASEK